MPRERSQIVSSLTSKGFGLRQGKRDHDFLFFEHHNLTQAVFTKVSRGTEYREVGDKLLAKMSRQLKLTRKQFDELVDCPMQRPQYLEALREQGLLRLPPANAS